MHAGLVERYNLPGTDASDAKRDYVYCARVPIRRRPPRRDTLKEEGERKTERQKAGFACLCFFLSPFSFSKPGPE
jgi:hypothetical protein